MRHVPRIFAYKTQINTFKLKSNDVSTKCVSTWIATQCISTDLRLTDEHEKNPDYVARGLKAAIHNPNVSSEAKDHAAQQLEDMGIMTSNSDAQKLSDEEHIRHQLGK